MSSRKKIALVTEELSIFPPSGGIGAAFFELALVLNAAGHTVDVIFVPTSFEVATQAKEGHYAFDSCGIRLIVPDFGRYVWGGEDYSKKSYTVFKTLEQAGYEYDYIHFHEYKGLGFATVEAKRCGLAFGNSEIITQLHGPTAWTIQANKTLLSHQDQLRIDHMERRAIAGSDVVISPSHFLLDWLEQHNYVLPAISNRFVIKNLMKGQSPLNCEKSNHDPVSINEIVMFGRHEGRKGVLIFADAIRQLSKQGKLSGKTVTFLGGFGDINGRHSGVVLTEILKDVDCHLSFITDANREMAHAYLRSRDDVLVVVPSPEENLPYTVFEAISLGKPVLSSNRGGGRELLSAEQHESHLFEPTTDGLRNALENGIENGLAISRLNESFEEVERQWLDFHNDVHHAPPPEITTQPRVMLGITHYERPKKLLDALWSAIRQDYPNLEIVVVDDGSKSEEALKVLSQIKPILARFGGKLIYQENAYLGAARNAAVRNSTSDYVIFLDDDDIAFPDMVSRLVRAAVLSKAEVVNCPNVFMEEARRGEALLDGENFSQKLSYFPLGGPLSLGAFENWFGSATALISRPAFEKVGGYTEEKGVGFEDYEFLLRIVQSGGQIAILPKPLYLYEVDRPSMISQTSVIANYRRVFGAIDSSLCGTAMRDVVQMVIGQKALSEQEARVNREESQDPNRALLQDVRESAGDHKKVRKALALYSDALGAISAARGWRSSSILQKGVEEQEQPFSPLRAGRPKPFYNQKAESDVMVLLALGRIEDAAEHMMRSCKQTIVSTDTALDFYRLCTDNSVPIQIVDRLTTELLNRKMMFKEAVMIVTAALSYAISKNEIVSALSHYLTEVYILEEEAYRYRYPDVGDAIAIHRILPDAMEHFKRHGFEENRSGFNLFVLVSERLSKKFGKVLPWELSQLLGYPTFLEMMQTVKGNVVQNPKFGKK